jgi:hypothetical protein
MPSINEERIFGSDKVYKDVNDEECHKCGAKPPNALKFGMRPCEHMKIVGGIHPVGWCGKIHYAYRCRNCQAVFDFDEILHRVKVFVFKKTEKKILVTR